MRGVKSKPTFDPHGLSSPDYLCILDKGGETLDLANIAERTRWLEKSSVRFRPSAGITILHPYGLWVTTNHDGNLHVVDVNCIQLKEDPSIHLFRVVFSLSRDGRFPSDTQGNVRMVCNSFHRTSNISILPRLWQRQLDEWFEQNVIEHVERVDGETGMPYCTVEHREVLRLEIPGWKSIYSSLSSHSPPSSKSAAMTNP